jgi:polyisoprenoid-binding protein YceI
VDVAVPHRELGVLQGRFRSIRGWANIDPDDVARSTISAQLDARDLDFGTNERYWLARAAELLNARRFPVIHFQSRHIARSGPRTLGIEGELSIRGQRRTIALDVLSKGRVLEGLAGDREGFSASTVLDRREFGVIGSGSGGSGDGLLGHEISVEVELELVRLDPGPMVA